MATKIFMDAYASYGLTESPFKVHALGSDERGERLLVGRDREIALVAQRLHKHGKITCLDGHVGVGKTSLVNVAAYQCFKAFLTADTPQLLIPMKESFQLKKDEDVHEFALMVFRKVAQTLLLNRERLTQYDSTGPVAKFLDPWLNAPVVSNIQEALGGRVAAGLPGVFTAEVNGTRTVSAALNTTSAFSEQGFEQLVRAWLDQLFAVEGNGGVVCVIDNLELLESGASARRTLEALRDRLFTVNGLRWVFCGANGVIHSLAASPRLASFLSTPIIDVANVPPGAIAPLVRSRFAEFSSDAELAEKRLPIRIQDLEKLYMAVNFNLRDLLGLADDFCEHMHAIGATELSDDQKAKRFDKWLDSNSTKSYQSLQSRLPMDAWGILDFAMSDECRGTFGVGDYESFNATSKKGVSQTKFVKWLRDLMKLGLLSKTLDDDAAFDDGFKRDVFTVTAKGALVHFARLMKNETHSLATVTWLRRVHAK